MPSMGALQVLFLQMQTSNSFTTNSVSFAFGEENKVAQEFNLPYVCMVPVSGNYDKDTPGYEWQQFDSDSGQYTDSQRDMMWPNHQTIEFWCWNFSTVDSATGLDHATACENLRAWVLQALWDQRALKDDSGNLIGGLYFEPVNERWAMLENAETRYGRALVLTCVVDITVPYYDAVLATISEVTINSVTVETD